ncbi:hypothetical protein CDAR_545871 [Caerostris darwini]|uniref:Uncharacterized protein n=1 Tax=Caerostris darwini TaxID=1538125 RepID=A0AAV4TPK6_9ARAC|nr:hypothetical protein CDAR_545871 [Caerostris darwini]
MKKFYKPSHQGVPILTFRFNSPAHGVVICALYFLLRLLNNQQEFSCTKKITLHENTQGHDIKYISLENKRQPVNFHAIELRTCRYPILELNCAILQRIQSLNIESPVSRVQLMGLKPSTYRNALECFSELNNCLKLEGLRA